jgi:hypothetical protein
MSETSSGPPLSASGTDPIIAPPPPPPADASNDPTDRARGIPGEMSADEQAAADKARREPAAADVSRETPDSTPAVADTGKPAVAKPDEDAALDADGKPLLDADGVPLKKLDFSSPQQRAAFVKERNRRVAAETAATERTAAADARADAAQKRLDEALAAVAALTPKPAPEPIAEPRPQREAFASPEAYDQAIDQWGARNAEIAATKARTDATNEQRVAQETAQREANERTQTEFVAKTEAGWQERRAKAAAEIPDFAEFAESDKVTISEPMGFAIKTADNGPQIAYHLGKNPTEAARIAGLPLGMQIFEMGKLAATLAQPARAVVSNAPRPITPLPASSESSAANQEESMAQVAARVAKANGSRRIPIIGARN